MHQPLPWIVVIIYFCKLFGHSPVYSCILIRLMFLQFLLWLLMKLHLIDYALSRVDWEVVILKPRQEALMQLQNGTCCTLAVQPFMFNFKIEAHQFFSRTECCVGYFTICVPNDYAGGSLVCRSESSNTVKWLVLFPCYVIVWFYGKMCE